MEASSLERGAPQGTPDEFETVYTDQGTTTTCTPVGAYSGDDVSTDKFLTGLRVAGYTIGMVESAVGRGRNSFDISFHSALEAIDFRKKYGPQGENLKIGSIDYRVAPALPIPKSVRKPWTPLFVTGVAVCIQDEKISSKLKKYAEVKAIYRLTHRNFPSVQNGTRKVMVTNIKGEIAERMYIEGCRAWVTRKGGNKCFKCGKTGHIARNCPIYDDDQLNENQSRNALSSHSTWGNRHASTPKGTPHTPHPNIPQQEADYTPIRDANPPGLETSKIKSPTETMRFIDSRHEILEKSELSWNSKDPTIPEEIPEPESESEWPEGGLATGLDISWTGEWPEPTDREKTVWEDASAGADPDGSGSEEGPATQDLFRTYSPIEPNPHMEPDLEESIEEGEIVSDTQRTPDPESAPSETKVPNGGAEAGLGASGDGEMYHSMTGKSNSNTPKFKTKVEKTKVKTKTKRKRPEPNSGDRKSSELKRKMYRTELEKIVDKNIKKILEGEKKLK